MTAEDKARASGNAVKLIEDGRRDLHRLHIPQAIKSLEGALALTEDHKQQAQASLLLAEAYYRRGDESKGKQAMETVARYAPDTALSPDRYPPVFIKAYDEVKARTPAATASSAASGSTTTLRSVLAANVFDNDARQRALASARSAGADTVVVLGMARGDRLFTLEAYAGQVRTGRWMALPIAQPDFDMLSAPAEASRLVRELETFKETALDSVLVHGLNSSSAHRRRLSALPSGNPLHASRLHVTPWDRRTTRRWVMLRLQRARAARRRAPNRSSATVCSRLILPPSKATTRDRSNR